MALLEHEAPKDFIISRTETSLKERPNDFGSLLSPFDQPPPP
jgi:hypothetical protein